jgi:hypothetical protein
MSYCASQCRARRPVFLEFFAGAFAEVILEDYTWLAGSAASSISEVVKNV